MTTPEQRQQAKTLMNPSTHRLIIVSSALCRKLREANSHPVFQQVFKTAFDNGIDYASQGPKWGAELKALEECVADLMRPARELKPVSLPMPVDEYEKDSTLTKEISSVVHLIGGDSIGQISSEPPTPSEMEAGEPRIQRKPKPVVEPQTRPITNVGGEVITTFSPPKTS